jgi:hypothetical protein
MQPRSTGKSEVDAGDAAAMCAGMPDEWLNAARYKWALDESVRKWLRIRLWMYAMELAQKERWQTKRLKVEGKELTLVMAELALDEMADPTLAANHWEGKERWQKLGGRLGVKSRNAWYTTWGPKYDRIFGMLEDWANCAYRHVARQQAA